MMPDGLITRNASLRNISASSLSRCSNMWELYRISTDSSCKGSPFVASAYSILLLRANLHFWYWELLINLSFSRSSGRSGIFDRRRLKELSKFLQPCVGVCPQPIFIRNAITFSSCRCLPLAATTSVTCHGLSNSDSNPWIQDTIRCERHSVTKPFLYR